MEPGDASGRPDGDIKARPCGFENAGLPRIGNTGPVPDSALLCMMRNGRPQDPSLNQPLNPLNSSCGPVTNTTDPSIARAASKGERGGEEGGEGTIAPIPKGAAPTASARSSHSGTPRGGWLPYADAMAEMTRLGITRSRPPRSGNLNQKSFRLWCRDHGELRRKLRVPSNPDVAYKGQGWVSWACFLGNEAQKCTRVRPKHAKRPHVTKPTGKLKKPAGAFVQFLNTIRPTLRQEHPELKGGDASAFAKLGGARWAKLSSQEVQSYKQQYWRQKEAYDTALRQQTPTQTSDSQAAAAPTSDHSGSPPLPLKHRSRKREEDAASAAPTAAGRTYFKRPHKPTPSESSPLEELGPLHRFLLGKQRGEPAAASAGRTESSSGDEDGDDQADLVVTNAGDRGEAEEEEDRVRANATQIEQYHKLMSEVHRQNAMYFNLWNKGAYEGMCGVIRPVLTAESQLPKTFGGATFPLNIQYDSVFKLFQLLTTVDDHAVIYSDPAGTGKTGVLMMLLTVLKYLGANKLPNGERQGISKNAPAIIFCPIAVFEHIYRESLLCQGPNKDAQPTGCIDICFVEDVEGLATTDLDQGRQDVYVMASTLMHSSAACNAAGSDSKKVMNWIHNKTPSLMIIDEAHTLATTVGRTKGGRRLPVMTNFLMGVRASNPSIWLLAISADIGWDNADEIQGGIQRMAGLLKQALGLKGDLSERIVANQDHQYDDYMAEIMHHEVGPIVFDAEESERIEALIASRPASKGYIRQQALRFALPFERQAVALVEMIKQHPGEQFSLYAMDMDDERKLIQWLADCDISVLTFARFKRLHNNMDNPHSAQDAFAMAIEDKQNQVIVSPRVSYERGVNDLQNVPNIIFWDLSHRQHKNTGTRNQIIHRHRRLSSKHKRVDIWSFGYNAGGVLHPFKVIVDFALESGKRSSKDTMKVLKRQLAALRNTVVDRPTGVEGALQAPGADPASAALLSKWQPRLAADPDQGERIAWRPDPPGGGYQSAHHRPPLATSPGMSHAETQPTLASAAAAPEHPLQVFLLGAGIGQSHVSRVLELADAVGIEAPADFGEVSEQELVGFGFKPLHARKIIKIIAAVPNGVGA